MADDDDVAIAAVTAAELLVGVELADAPQRAGRATFVDDRVSGTPRGAHDLIIAATAVATERTVVTTDVRGFRDLSGVDVRVV